MLTLRRFGPGRTVLAYLETGAESEDNERFLTDCEHWLAHPIVRLRSNKYSTVDEVIAGERFMRGPRGAPCTL